MGTRVPSLCVHTGMCGNTEWITGIEDSSFSSGLCCHLHTVHTDDSDSESV